MVKLGKALFIGVSTLAVCLMLSGGAIAGKTIYCNDTDGDGYGDPDACSRKYVNGMVENSQDCNDNNSAINPAAAEICDLSDLTDENCSGTANEGCLTWWEDRDSDSYTTGNTFFDYTGPEGYVLEDGLVNTTEFDCNDQNLSINPSAAEICDLNDLTDENCSGAANEGCLTWWEDGDVDNYTTGNTAFDYTGPAGYVLEGTLVNTTDLDCNDADSAINPGAEELYGDQVDQNCDGNIGIFSDPNLRACIMNYTGGSYDPLDLASLTTLQCQSDSITDLTGMEYLTGLMSLDFYNNQINDLSLLAGLTELVNLDLSTNNINDLTDLESLTGLISLDLRDNQITNLLPLVNLTLLIDLDLSLNDISVLAGLESLTGLTSLDLMSNQISDLLPLSGLTALVDLNLYYNSIVNLAGLENLVNLTILDLGSNDISDLSPLNTPNLNGLSELSLPYNNVAVSSLSALTGLTVLDLSNNIVNDISGLAELTQMVKLSLAYNVVNNTSALENMPALDILFMNYCPIGEIPSLINPVAMTLLDLEGTSISDISGLASFTGLTGLNISYNSISNINSLANISGLNILLMADNDISDLSPLASIDLSQMGWLDFSYNSITDLTPLANLWEYCDLGLAYNCITDFSPVYHVQFISGMYEQCM